MSSLQEHIARHERAEGGNTMTEQNKAAKLISDTREALKPGNISDRIVTDHEFRHMAQRLVKFCDLAESQQQRIRELEQQALKDARENTALQRERDQYAEEWADADAFAKVNAMNAADYFTACAERDTLRQQLAARDAVIAEIDDWFNNLGGTPCPDGERLARILDAAPETVLAERVEGWASRLEPVTVRKVIDYLEADIDWPNIGFIVSGIAKHFGLVK